jgi:hypothetical protein
LLFDVGATVGTTVVGTDVVGLFDGLDVGEVDGETVGESVGIVVGELVGTTIHCIDSSLGAYSPSGQS